MFKIHERVRANRDAGARPLFLDNGTSWNRASNKSGRRNWHCGEASNARSTGSARRISTRSSATAMSAGSMTSSASPPSASRPSATPSCGSASRHAASNKPTGPGSIASCRRCATPESPRSPAWSIMAADRATPACSSRRLPRAWPSTPGRSPRVTPGSSTTRRSTSR